MSLHSFHFSVENERNFLFFKFDQTQIKHETTRIKVHFRIKELEILTVTNMPNLLNFGGLSDHVFDFSISSSS